MPPPSLQCSALLRKCRRRCAPMRLLTRPRSVGPASVLNLINTSPATCGAYAVPRPSSAAGTVHGARRGARPGGSWAPAPPPLTEPPAPEALPGYTLVPGPPAAPAPPEPSPGLRISLPREVGTAAGEGRPPAPGPRAATPF